MTAFKPLALATIALIAGTSIADAAGWSRSGGGTGPRGRTWSSQSSGSCSGGSCTRTSTWSH